MKSLFWSILVSFLVSACAADHLFMSTPDLSKATIDNPARHKVWFESIPAEGNILECGLPSAGRIKGHCNLMGDINSEKSPFSIWHWHWDPNAIGLKVYESIEGTITGEKGDSYFFTGIIITNLTDMSFSGKMFINGGTGTLECIDGECYMTGNIANGVSSWTAEGLIALNKPAK